MLELDRLNFIRGPNSCGKSSVRMAIEYLFTGACGLTDAAGRGAETLIRAGEGEFEVSATLANGETMSRRRTRRSQIVEVNGKRVSVDVAESLIVRQCASADILSAVLNADPFSEMSATEQRRSLSRLVEVGQIKIPEEICRAFDAINEEVPTPKSLADLEAAYKRFCDLRAETNHALECAGKLSKPPAGSGLSIGKATGDQAAGCRQHAETRERPSFRASRPDTFPKMAENITHQREAEFDELLFESPGLWEEDELLRLGSTAEHAKELRRQLAELTSERETISATLDVMQGLREKCPTCGQAISEAIQRSEIEGSRKRLGELTDLIERTREELSCYGVPENPGSGRRVQEIVLTKPPNDLERPFAIDQEKFNRSSREWGTVQQRVVAPAVGDPCQRERSSLKKRLGALEQLVEFFGPGGAIAQEAGRRVERFRRTLDEHLSAFGYACNLTLEPFNVRISLPRNGCTLVLRQLSESERFRFGVAFQIALAAITGIRFVVIDRADMLDKARRKLLTALLLSSDVEQAIVFATGDEFVPVQLPEGVKFFDLGEPFRA